jgi:two-component system sensor histidine kinase/response regulator
MENGPSLNGLRVLLVDDGAINRKVAKAMLGKVGVSITEACDGTEAIELLENDPGAFDIVLIDVQMPVMDGLMVTKRIRINPQFSSLPVIAMTAFAMKEDQQRCMDAGMNDHVSKPINMDELYTTLAKYKR